MSFRDNPKNYTYQLMYHFPNIPALTILLQASTGKKSAAREDNFHETISWQQVSSALLSSDS